MIQNVILDYDNNNLEEKSDLENEDDCDNNDLEKKIIVMIKCNKKKLIRRKKVIMRKNCDKECESEVI